MCSVVSLDQLGTDVRVMAETFQLAVGELVKDQDNIQLRDFVIATEEKINDLKDRFQMAQDTFQQVVRFYGEDPKTTQPGQFFNEFSRFIAAYKVRSVWSLCVIYLLHISTRSPPLLLFSLIFPFFIFLIFSSLSLQSPPSSPPIIVIGLSLISYC